MKKSDRVLDVPPVRRLFLYRQVNYKQMLAASIVCANTSFLRKRYDPDEAWTPKNDRLYIVA